jgi:arylsulfatase A-like enzyme
MEQAGDQPWCLHLSYIKPHWPYIVPPPYHDMYGPEDVVPPVRAEAEKENAHPLLAAYHQKRFSKAFSRDEVRERVIPAYMGLITQIDDQIGRLLAWLEETGRDTETMIVFTSDHGDYLGDHWLGEKELFHDCSARIPLIVVDPDPASDATRGAVDTRLVEAIDLAPTFVEWMGGTVRGEVLEGRSLLPLLHGLDVPWREVCFSEYDYSWRKARRDLEVPIAESRLVMAFDGRWKLIHCEGMPPLLFDLETDPDELVDRGRDPDCAGEVERLRGAILSWALRHHRRTTISDAEIAKRGGQEHARGIWIGFWDEADQAEALAAGTSGN